MPRATLSCHGALSCLEPRYPGVYGYLKDDKRGPPPRCYQGRSFFRNVPRPPNGWKGYPRDDTDNGGELPKK